MNPTIAGHLAQLVSISVWSVGLVVQKSLTPAAGPGGILAVQFLAAAGLLWAGLALRRALPPLAPASLLPVAWGMFAPGLVLILSIAGAARTDGVSLMLMWGLVPLLVPLLARLMLGEPLHWSFPVAGLVGLGGMALLAADRVALGVGDPLGNLLVLGGVVCAAFSQVIGRRLNTGRMPWYQVATLQVTGAALAATVLMLAAGHAAPNPADVRQLGAVVYLVLGMTVVNFLAFNLALARIRAAWVSLYVCLSPAIGALAAAALLGTPLRPIDLVGIAVASGAVALPHLLRLTRHGAR
jgi:probable blue pigment (indigoidine) exporter